MGKTLVRGWIYAQTCFIAQQAGEKALKAFCFYKGFDIVKTHSLFQIVRSLKEDGILEKNARELDIFYISGRYPDAFPEGVPYELITKEQAERALAAANEIYDIVVQRLKG